MLNCDPVLMNEIKKHITVVDLDRDPRTNCDVFFIDFSPTKSDKTPEKAAKLVRQVDTLEDAVKKKKMVLLFDRYLSLTTKEYDWLKKFNTRFLEPALNNRTNFTYLPFWYVPKTLDEIMISDSDRPYVLGYKGNVSDRIKSFESYYVSFAKIYPNYKVAYDKSIERVKEEEYKNYNIERKKFDYIDCKYTIILGTHREYTIGYLDNFTFKALNSNCVPLIPLDHRYFGNIGWKYWTAEDLKYLHNQYEKAHVGLLLEVYDSLDRFYPEMKIQNVAESIIRLAKGN